MEGCPRQNNDADVDDPEAFEDELCGADVDDDDGVMDMSDLSVGHAGDDVGAIVSGDVGSMAVDEIDALARPPGEEASASDAPPPLVPAPPPAAPQGNSHPGEGVGLADPASEELRRLAGASRP